MLNLTRPNFEAFKRTLLRQQKKVEEELTSLETKDPVLDDSLAESSEPGTESWMADVHNQAVALKHNLHELLKGIRHALANIKSGKYGRCERCGREIEPERLKAMPTATLCLTCSKIARR